jgi:ubiquinone/menaquinone biosynthesis C-methylase UbiE
VDRNSEAGYNIQGNLTWWDNAENWQNQGDEWQGQAHVCGIPYSDWKLSLVENLIRPNAGRGRHVLEIAPGQGRWTEFLAETSAFTTLVDLSPNCLSYCQRRFAAKTNVDYFLTTGMSLPHYCTEQINFIWSYDAFVHMHAEVIASYLSECARVLKNGGTAIIHHANVRDLASHVQDKAPGWRSAVNAGLVRQYAEAVGLVVKSQITYWDEPRTVGVPRFDDKITILTKAG